MCCNIAVASLTTRSAEYVTAILLVSTDVAARDIDGSLTRVRSKHELIWPAEGEACGFIGVFGC